MLLKVSSNFNYLPVVSTVPLSPPPSRHDLVFLAVATGGEPEMEEDKNVMMVKAPRIVLKFSVQCSVKSCRKNEDHKS